MSQKFGLITGCGKGIGFAIAKKLLYENKKIILLGISRTSNPEIEKAVFVGLDFGAFAILGEIYYRNGGGQRDFNSFQQDRPS